MKMLTTTIAAISIALFAITASAHGDNKSKHGGLVKEVNEIQYEIVAKPEQITIHVTDHGEKIKLKDASGKLTMLVGKDKTEVPLTVVGDDMLVAKGKFNVAKGVKVLAMIKNAGKTASVSWTLK
jgi:hypothetical protein